MKTKIINWKYVTHVRTHDSCVYIHYVSGDNITVKLNSDADVEIFLDECHEKILEHAVTKNFKNI